MRRLAERRNLLIAFGDADRVDGVALIGFLLGRRDLFRLHRFAAGGEDEQKAEHDAQHAVYAAGSSRRAQGAGRIYKINCWLFLTGTASPARLISA